MLNLSWTDRFIFFKKGDLDGIRYNENELDYENLELFMFNQIYGGVKVAWNDKSL